jgi:preprotein translocase subunit SecE
VARNRKRAKERRARRPQPVATRRADGRAEADRLGQPDRAEQPETTEQAPEPTEEQLEPTEEQLERAEQEIVAGPTSARPDELAPDPLQHSAPDVELADAEAFGPSQPGDAEFEHEEELVEKELEEQREERAAHPAPAPGERPNLFPRLAGFLQGSWRELQRVQWPDRRQVAQATGVVIGFVIVAGVFLGVSDLVAQKLVNFILK